MSVIEWIAAAKAGFEAGKAALSLAKDIQSALPPSEQSKAIGVAIEASAQQLKLAEVQMAQALGYQLCRCTFPPNIMLAVGYGAGHDPVGTNPVYECPECHITTAGDWTFQRTRDLLQPRQQLLDKT